MKRKFTQNINHSREPLSAVPALFTKQRDLRLQTSGIVRGFTLIELLVVVLIIGILAAIALPQYQKAVAKTRFAAAIPKVHALEQGLHEYYLNNGYYKMDYDAFAVGDKFVQTVGCNAQFCQVDIGSGMHLEVVNANGSTEPQQYYEVYCLANANNNIAISICSDYGQYVHDNKGYKYYRMKRVHGSAGATYYGNSIPL